MMGGYGRRAVKKTISKSRLISLKARNSFTLEIITTI